MRLTKDQVTIILAELARHDSQGQVYLHGSRIDDSKKGGDIDLFFIVRDQLASELKKNAYKIKAALSLQLQEQRVDLTVLSKSEIADNNFFTNSEKVCLSEVGV